jgi:PHD/YefM family antitoxin component YafN of YafNO toxin-antitoxin module
MPTIVPISKLNNTSEISALAHKTDGPVFVTKNGYGDMAVMSMDVYEELASAATDRDIAIGELEIARGEGIVEASEFFSRMRKLRRA